MIGDGKLAARLKGREDPCSSDRECPICFFNYPDINVTKCCQALICTECYLQVKPQKASSKNKQGKVNQHNCPFCNASRLQVSVAPASSKLELGVEQALDDPQKMESRTDGTSTPPHSEASPPTSPHQEAATASTPTTGFGSHLEKNERVAMMRKRSESLHSDGASASGAGLQPQQSPVQEISNLAMTPEERHHLEQEMRAQHHHPLTMRLEQEEAERRMRNEMRYYQQRVAGAAAGHHTNRRTIADVRRQAAGGASASGLPQLSRSTTAPAGRLLPPSGGRDWNRLVDALERSGGAARGNDVPLDDLVVLEAAFRLSMDEDARRAPSRFPLTARARLSEEQQIAMAIAASLRESAAAPAAAASSGEEAAAAAGDESC